jgi:TPP-dependent pyruvate/acetoin dehydrogenase alpha subunit
MLETSDQQENDPMTTITVHLDDSKAALLRERAEKLGLSLDEFVKASIEELLAQPEPEFEAAMRRVLSKNKELYERLA